MTKLTKALRDEIVNNAAEKLFEKEFEEIRKNKKEFGDRFFSKHIATPEQYAVMEKLPAHFFRSSEEIYVNLNGRSIDIPLSGQRRTPAWASGYACPEINDPDMKKEWDVLDDEMSKLFEKKAELIQEIRKVVLSVNTIARLLEVWPESRAFIPAHAFLGTTKNVPATIVANLTAAMIQAGVQFTEPANA